MSQRRTLPTIATDAAAPCLAMVARSHVLTDHADRAAFRRSIDHLIRLAWRAPLRFTTPDEAFPRLGTGAEKVPGAS